MPSQPSWESPVEKQIREAQERGDFDNLPGAG
ncbi:MAG TPA: DnaJ family domain-containing protein, partial [Humibacillus xanthopallidus]|nr:DnaJ family domain-containing protein [Humibacillus xanthopallidus]